VKKLKISTLGLFLAAMSLVPLSTVHANPGIFHLRAHSSPDAPTGKKAFIGPETSLGISRLFEPDVMSVCWSSDLLSSFDVVEKMAANERVRSTIVREPCTLALLIGGYWDRSEPYFSACLVAESRELFLRLKKPEIGEDFMLRIGPCKKV
jgi:hypothetical protein